MVAVLEAANQHAKAKVGTVIVGTYFKPLRRKIGVVTLLMSCLLAANWALSSVSERYLQTFGFGLDSTNEEVQFLSASEMCCVAMFSVSHQPIVIPLTALSAYLLLSNPKPSRRKTE